jgi:hypothetical protein
VWSNDSAGLLTISGNVAADGHTFTFAGAGATLYVAGNTALGDTGAVVLANDAAAYFVVAADETIGSLALERGATISKTYRGATLVSEGTLRIDAVLANSPSLTVAALEAALPGRQPSPGRRWPSASSRSRSCS